MMPDRVSPSFFQKPTISLAQSLIGCTIHSRNDESYTSGIIVETEAYHGETDEACHCYYRRTPRNEVMFHQAGHLYVYMIYGIHFCINIVTEQENIGAAVLIRAIEPIAGIDTMQKRRSGRSLKDLCNGPGKLAQALGITDKENGIDLLQSSKVFISKNSNIKATDIIQTTRIGISKAKDLPWRFYLKNSPHVSKL